MGDTGSYYQGSPHDAELSGDGHSRIEAICDEIRRMPSPYIDIVEFVCRMSKRDARETD